MYKKLISSILVIALLNILGCYSSNDITVNELREFKGNNNVIIETNNGGEFTLKRDTTSHYYSNWEFVGDSIEWTESRVIYLKDNTNLGKFKTTKTTIAENEILKIGIEELNVLNTALLTVGILVVAVLIIFTLDFERNLGSNN
jgi:hypothetical protein